MRQLAILILCAITATANAATNAVFSDGVSLFTMGGATNLTSLGKAHETAVLTWSSSDLQNAAINLFGTAYETKSSGATIDSGTPQTVAAYNEHIVLNVQTITTTGAVTVAGLRVHEDTGAISNFTETVHVTATNYYQTAAKFLGTVTNSTASADITTDIIETTYIDFQNQDFTVESVRVSFRPSNPSWDIGVSAFILDNDGLTNSLFDGQLTFAAGDTIPRAANGQTGHAKVNISSRTILGSQKEGLIVQVTGGGDATPSNITEFDLTIQCELK